jgi:UDP-N-acetylmuramoyl-tripeptide--D-alanyl-D-alanine ligase
MTLAPLWTADAIAAATGGTVSAPFTVDGVTFDSREVIGGELFVALTGEVTDGHRFAAMAAQRGAAGMLVSEPVDGPHVRVADTMAGLTALAVAARARTDAKVIGVTGSVGKTGVKEALRAALGRSEPDHVHASVKSYNNHTGVPLSLARMPADTRFGVFEMGMNHAGELRALTALVRPHVAVVTAIASAHREFFASEEAIADAKGEIFAGLEPGGVAIVPFDSPHRDRLIAAAKPFAARIVTFGLGDGADVRATTHVLHADCTTATAMVGDRRLMFRVGLAGAHWLSNALAVLAAVDATGGDLALAGLALAELSGLPGRGERLTIARGEGAATVLDESYNANPASMAAALAVLGGIAATGRKRVILGEMKELGAGSDGFHAGLAPLIAAAGVNHAILVGAAMAPLAAALPRHIPALLVDDAAAALAAVETTLAAGDVLLIKGSNSVGLGAVVAALRKAVP